MGKDESKDLADIRELLINALETELAALTASVGFWREWIALTSEQLKVTAASLTTIRSEGKGAGQVLLELVDSSRERMRMMTELPRNAAAQFIRQLDALEETKRSSAKHGPSEEVAGASAAPAGGAKKHSETIKKRRVAKRRAQVKP